MSRKTLSTEDVALAVRRCLTAGRTVEIDGIGTFRPTAEGGIEFAPRQANRVFLAYVEEDSAEVERLYHRFEAAGLAPWMDRKKLLPGQNWPRSLEMAIGISDFFVACFSRKAVSKRGHFQAELRYALQCASRLPLDEIFLIPIRLDECTVPARITREIQYVDMFPNWEKGFQRVLATISQSGKLSKPQLRLAG